MPPTTSSALDVALTTGWRDHPCVSSAGGATVCDGQPSGSLLLEPSGRQRNGPANAPRALPLEAAATASLNLLAFPESATNMIRLSILIAGLCTASLAAQNCSLRGHFQLRTGVPAQVGPSGDVRIDSGLQTLGPVVSSGISASGNAQGCAVNANCTTTVDYGRLQLTASGAGGSCSNGAQFLLLDSWIGGRPNGEFTDRLTVVAPQLAAGTPVTLRVSVQLSGSATATSSFPSPAFDTSYYAARLFVNNNQAVIQANSSGSSTNNVVVTVGSQVPVSGDLVVRLRAGGMEIGGVYTGSIAAAVVATFDIAALTPGVTLVACSGTNYDRLTARALPVGSGCGATPPGLGANPPVLGSTCNLALSGAPVGAPVFRGLSLGTLVATPIGSCVLQLDPASAFFDFAGLANPLGQLVMPVPIPNFTSLLGAELGSQALILATNGPLLDLAELSNGVGLRLGF